MSDPFSLRFDLAAQRRGAGDGGATAAAVGGLRGATGGLRGGAGGAGGAGGGGDDESMQTDTKTGTEI